MGPLGLYADFRIGGAVARRVRYLFAGLLYVVPNFGRLILVRNVPGTVRLLRRFIYVQYSLFLVVPFKRYDHFRGFGGGCEVVYHRYASTFYCGVKIEGVVLVANVCGDEGEIIGVLLGEVVRAALTAQ